MRLPLHRPVTRIVAEESLPALAQVLSPYTLWRALKLLPRFSTCCWGLHGGEDDGGGGTGSYAHREENGVYCVDQLFHIYTHNSLGGVEDSGRSRGVKEESFEKSGRSKGGVQESLLAPLLASVELNKYAEKMISELVAPDEPMRREVQPTILRGEPYSLSLRAVTT